MLNNNGPRTDPCGTPCSSSVQELNDVLILVLCQNLINSLIIALRILYQIHKHEVLRSKIHTSECQTPWKDPSKLRLENLCCQWSFSIFLVMTKERVEYCTLFCSHTDMGIGKY